MPAPLLSVLPERKLWRPAFRHLPIDVPAGLVRLPGRAPRRLTPQEQAVLGVLLTKRLATRDLLISALWGIWLEPPPTMSSALRLLVTWVRRKLAGTGAAVVTITGVGYRLVVVAND